MKKGFLLLILLFGVSFLFLKNHDEEIRIRVISHSGQDCDIYYKEEVVEYLKDKILKNKKLNHEYFKNNYKKIEERLNEKFNNIRVTYEKHYFENKVVDNNVIENKVYDTLLIYIGDADGPNWWGSVFDGVLKKESSDEIKYEWYFKNRKDTNVRNKKS